MLLKILLLCQGCWLSHRVLAGVVDGLRGVRVALPGPVLSKLSELSRLAGEVLANVGVCVWRGRGRPGAGRGRQGRERGRGRGLVAPLGEAEVLQLPQHVREVGLEVLGQRGRQRGEVGPRVARLQNICILQKYFKKSSTHDGTEHFSKENMSNIIVEECANTVLFRSKNFKKCFVDKYFLYLFGIYTKFWNKNKLWVNIFPFHKSQNTRSLCFPALNKISHGKTK